MDPRPGLVLHSVSKRYGERLALRDVDLRVDGGELCYLVGPSGAGKSTLLDLVTGRTPPSAGEVRVLGLPVHRMGTGDIAALRRRIGIVFQDIRLLEERTLAENLAFPLELRAVPAGEIRGRVAHVLELVGLAGLERRRPRELSGGEAQRAAIARAIVTGPELLLADEPTGDLDPATSIGIARLLRAINASGTTVIVATHDPMLVAALPGRTILLVEGRVIGDGYLERYPTDAIARFASP